MSPFILPRVIIIVFVGKKEDKAIRSNNNTKYWIYKCLTEEL
jgi:hypothetical protein